MSKDFYFRGQPYIMVMLGLENGATAFYWVPRPLCERAAKIAAAQGLPEATPQQMARYLALSHAKAEGKRLDPGLKELAECVP